MDQKDKREILGAIGAVGNIGFTLAASVIVGLFLGNWIDKHMNTSPWAATIGIILGIATGFWSIYNQVVNRK
jgi:ATP synthase protein I